MIDLDIRKSFDSVPWDLVVKAVEAHTDDSWVVLYVKRWLAAPLQHAGGSLQARDRGTPQGSAVSPVLANLFMHYAFDLWLSREFPTVAFERYADDAVVHCVSKRQAEEVLTALRERMVEVGLQLHPDKTKVVYLAPPSAIARAYRLGAQHPVRRVWRAIAVPAFAVFVHADAFGRELRTSEFRSHTDARDP